MKDFCQVLVIGGGPAGSTTASLLARAGFDVVLLEKETFPRYHIGESLLPACLPLLELVGVREEVESYGFQRKAGAYFQWGDEQWHYHFGEISGQYAHSYQVTRADFDHILLKNAKALGVNVVEGVEVRELTFDGERPISAKWRRVAQNGVAQNGDASSAGEIRFEYLVDASGRRGIMANQYLNGRQYHEAFQNVALWGYWQGAEWIPNAPEGALTAISIPDGWFWFIPLHDGTTSVGLVTHKTSLAERRENRSLSLEAVYQQAVEECPLLVDLLAQAELVSPVKIEQDYSYVSDRFAGPGYFIAGDAACFVDPLLSSGVHLAMFSGMMAAASLSSVLLGEISAETAYAFYDESYRRTYLRFMVLVSVFYDQYRGQESYFWEAQQLSDSDCEGENLKQAFVSIVSGLEDMNDIQEQNVRQAVVERVRHLHEEGYGILKEKDSLADLPEEEYNRRKELAVEYNAIVQASQLRTLQSPEAAVQGLYITTEPILKLARVEKE